MTDSASAQTLLHIEGRPGELKELANHLVEAAGPLLDKLTAKLRPALEPGSTLESVCEDGERAAVVMTIPIAVLATARELATVESIRQGRAVSAGDVLRAWAIERSGTGADPWK